jgi:predicted Zn-dependent protease
MSKRTNGPRAALGWLLALCLAAPLASAQWAAPVTADAAPLGGGGAETAAVSPGRLPALGEAQVWSLGREQRLGERLMAALYRQQAVREDAVMQDYLAAIWGPLFDSARRSGLLTPAMADRFDWPLLIIQDASVNAFAMPGGVVGVHLGLLAATETPAQVAAVLAHELSHVSQRHMARLIERQNQVSPLAIGAAMLALLAAGDGAASGDAAQAVFVGSQAALAQSGINFTRDMEREADRIGQRIFDGAGFPSQAFGEMFNRLYEASRLNDDGSFPYLRTHPLTRERLAEVMARDSGRLADVGPGPVPEVWATLMRARAQVMQTTRREDWQDWWLATPDATVTAPGMAYRAALAAERLGEYEDAWRRLQHLAQRDWPQPVQALWRAERLRLWAVAPKPLAEPATVKAWVAEGLEDPARAVWLNASRLAVRWPDLQSKASARLQAWLVAHAGDAPAWSALMQLREAQGQQLRALRAQAEAALARGQLDGALDVLQAAQEWSRAHPREDPVEAQVIWARERALREQQRAWAQAEREDG